MIDFAIILFPQERIRSLEKELNQASKEMSRVEILEQVSEAPHVRTVAIFVVDCLALHQRIT